MTQEAYGIDGPREDRLRRRRPTPSPARCARTPRRPRRSASWTRAVISPTRAAARAVPRVLPVPRPARRRPLRDRRRRRRTPSSRCASSTSTSSATPRPGRTRTLVYTHGYGLVAATGNERTTDGQPGVPRARHPGDRLPLGEDFEPRVYFGEYSPPYSIVGAPEGTAPVELDYPSGGDGASETKTTFTGDGGPKHRQRLQPADLRAEVPVRADPLLRLRQRGLADPLRPQPDRARAEGRAVPDARQRPVPERRRRPHRLDHRRLHAQRPTTRTRRR